jgi:hypothetical protein
MGAGQQQGTIDPAAEDLVKRAEDVVRAVQEGHADEVAGKLDELQRKATSRSVRVRSARPPRVGSARRSPSSPGRSSVPAEVTAAVAAACT